MKNLKNKLFIIFSLLCALALTSCMDLYDGSEVPTSFKVTFDGNGGSYVDGGIAATTYSQVYAFAEQKNLIANKFSKANCKFLGWAESATATTATFADEANFSTKTDRTLYAIWSEVTYTVTFVGNGGTTSEGKDTYTQEFKAGEEKEILPNAFVNYPTGKLPIGWAKSSSADKVDYELDSKITIDSDKTLYMVWELASKICTVTFEGGVGGSYTDASGVVHTSYTQVINPIPTTVPLSDNRFKNSDNKKIFKHWLSSSGATYTNKQSYSANTNSDTLTAIWADTKLYVSEHPDSQKQDGSETYPYPTLAQAVQYIQTKGDETKNLVWTVYIDGTITGNTDIPGYIPSKLILEKKASAASAVLKGDGTGSVLSLTATGKEFEIKEVTITGGNATYGGGLYIKDAIVTLNGGKIIGNKATSGGGVYVESGTFNLQSGSIGDSGTNEGNTATYGGGIYNNDGTVNMTGGSISYNTAVDTTTSNGNGGGIYNSGINGKFNFSVGTITDNKAGAEPGGTTTRTSKGGGIYNGANSRVTISGSAIVGREIATQITSSNCANYSNSDGGGIYNDGTLLIEGTEYKITGNYVYNDGGGVRSLVDFSNYSNITGNEGHDGKQLKMPSQTIN